MDPARHKNFEVTWLVYRTEDPSFRATIQGSEYSCQVYQGDQSFGVRTLHLTTPNVIPYIGFGTEDESCRFLIDNFGIRRLAAP